jgi:predicted small integral membrane protein
MWVQVGTLVIGLLGLLVSANLLTGGMTRNVRQIRAEADLLAVLPDSPGKDELAALVDQSVHEYVEDVRIGSFWTSGRRRFASRTGKRHTLRLVTIWTFLIAYIVGAALSLRSEEPVWWPLVTAVVVVVGVSAWALARRSSR